MWGRRGHRGANALFPLPPPPFFFVKGAKGANEHTDIAIDEGETKLDVVYDCLCGMNKRGQLDETALPSRAEKNTRHKKMED